MLRMMLLSCVIRRLSRKFSRSTSAMVKATAPELMIPVSQRWMHSTAIPDIIRPERKASEARSVVRSRVKRRIVLWKMSKPSRI